MDLFGMAYVWRVDNARELMEEELAELKRQTLETDETASTVYEQWKHFETLDNTAREKKKARWLVGRNIVRSAIRRSMPSRVD